MRWIEALKEWNKGKMWCIPRKGTKEHAEVMKIMERTKPANIERENVARREKSLAQLREEETKTRERNKQRKEDGKLSSFYEIGKVIEKLQPDDYQEWSRYKDAMRAYRIPWSRFKDNTLPNTIGFKIEFETIGESGGRFTVQPTPQGLSITVQTQANWAREYVYRDAFETVGDTLSSKNPHLKSQIKEIYPDAHIKLKKALK